MAALTTPFHAARSLWVAAGLMVLGGLGCIVGGLLSPRRVMFSYLAAFAFAMAVALGALFFLLIAHAVGAKWMIAVQRHAEAIALSLIPLALLFVPIAIWLPQLYAWAHPSAQLPARTLALLMHKRAYLNPSAFVLRSLLYFAIWIGTTATLVRHSRKRDRAEPGAASGHDGVDFDRAFSSVMLVPVSLATTFAAFDWLMSLEPTWYSSAFGLYFFAGGFVSAIALICVLACVGVVRGSTSGVVTAQHFHALGRLLLAFSIFWAYIAFFQAFLISIADKPVEVTFYVLRTRAGYRELALTVAALEFVLPFLLLLPRRVKFHPRYVALVGALVLVAHYADVAWLVFPVLMPAGLSVNPCDACALLFVVAASTLFCLWTQRGVLPVPEGDPALEAAIRYASPL